MTLEEALKRSKYAVRFNYYNEAFICGHDHCLWTFTLGWFLRYHQPDNQSHDNWKPLSPHSPLHKLKQAQEEGKRTYSFQGVVTEIQCSTSQRKP